MYNFRILHLDTSKIESDLITRKFKKEKSLKIYKHVETWETYIKELQSGNYNIIISEYKLKDFDGVDSLKYCRENYPNLPYIFLTAHHIGEENSIALLKAGADDIISKDGSERLLESIKKNIEYRNREKKIELIQTMYKDIVEKSSDWIFRVNKNFKIVYSNDIVKDILGFDKEYVLDKIFYDLLDISDKTSLKKIMNNPDIKSKKTFLDLNFINSDKKSVYVETHLLPLPEGKGFSFICRDITESKKQFNYQSLVAKRSSFILNLSKRINNQNLYSFITESVNKIGQIIDCDSVYCSTCNGLIFNRTTRNIDQLDQYSKTLKIDVEKHTIIFYKTKINSDDIDTINLLLLEIEKHYKLFSYNKKLRESYKRLKETQKIANIANWEYIRNLKSVKLTKNIKSMLGIDKNYLTLNDIKRIFNTIPLKKIFRTILTSKEFSIDIQINNKWFTIKGLPETKNGKLAKIIGTIQDITERIEYQSQLKELGIAIEQSIESIVMTDTKGNIVYANDSFAKVSEYSKEELIGRNSRILKSGNTPKETYEEMWKTINSGKTWKGLLFNRKKSGEDYIEYAIITPIKKADGTIYRFVGVKEDVTEKKKLGDDLDRYREHLEDLVEERTELLSETLAKLESTVKTKELFLANMSHEVRTPLNGILGFLTLLKETNTTDKQIDYITKIENAGKHLLNIINDILDLSKYKSGKLKLEYKEINVNNFINNLNSLFKTKAHAKGLDFKINNNIYIESFISDELRLNQALINLINNSIKFTDKGFVEINFNLVKTIGNTVEIEFIVKDTGIGIKKEEITRLFKPFEQEDISTTRKYGGTGLGLTITKQIAEILGGKITVFSEYGLGSEFKLTIFGFIANKKELNIESDYNDYLKLLQMNNKNLDVLVADDDPINREIVNEFLNKFTNKIEIVKDGLEAYEDSLKNPNHQIIILDMQMPEMSGTDAARNIRKIEYYKSSKILALTANVLEDAKLECINAGFDRILTKPFTKKDLYESIYKLIYPKINFTRIEELYEENINSYINITNIFFTDYDTEIITNTQKDKAYFHKIKGGAATLGLDRISNIAKSLEATPNNVDLFNFFKLTIEKTKNELSKYINQRTKKKTV